MVSLGAVPEGFFIYVLIGGVNAAGNHDGAEQMTIPPSGAEALINYKYAGEDRSLLYKKVLSPLAEWMVHNTVPLWLAPNVITFMGLVFPIISLIIFLCYCPTLVASSHDSEVIPRWAFLYNAFALFAYQTLDNMDGKQARRTQTSNALGMIFDHGCDAINAIVGALNLAVTLGVKPSDSPFTLCMALATPFVPFYVATWEEYYTGALVLPIINGPSEGVILGVFMALVSAYWGPGFWSQPRDFGGRVPMLNNYAQLICASSLASITITVVYNIINVLLHQRRRRESLVRPLLDLVPFIILCLGTTAVIVLAPPEICDAYLPYIIGTVGAVFVESVVQIMLAHMTHQVYHPHHRLLLVPFLFGVHASLTTTPHHHDSHKAGGGLHHVGSVGAVWWYLCLGVGIYTSLFLVSLVVELVLILNVRCFRIPSPPPPPVKGDGQVGGLKGGGGGGSSNGVSSKGGKQQ